MTNNPNNQNDKNQANRQQGGQGGDKQNPNPNKQREAQNDPKRQQQGGHQDDSSGGQQRQGGQGQGGQHGQDPQRKQHGGHESDREQRLSKQRPLRTAAEQRSDRPLRCFFMRGGKCKQNAGCSSRATLGIEYDPPSGATFSGT